MSESDTMFNERDRRCAAVQLMPSTDPSYDNRTIASTLKMQIWTATNNRDVPRVTKKKFPAMVMVFGAVSSEGHIMPPHIFEVSLKVNTKVYLDVLKSVVAGGRPRLGFIRSAMTLYPSLIAPSSSDLNPLDLSQHQSQPDGCHPPSIRRAPASTCGKACSQLRIHIDAVIEAEGGYIE